MVIMIFQINNELKVEKNNSPNITPLNHRRSYLEMQRMAFASEMTEKKFPKK
jgi:hypothetical protein